MPLQTRHVRRGALTLPPQTVPPVQEEQRTVVVGFMQTPYTRYLGRVKRRYPSIVAGERRTVPVAMGVAPLATNPGVPPSGVVSRRAPAVILVTGLSEIRIELRVSRSTTDPAIDVIVTAEPAGEAPDLRGLVPNELVTSDGGCSHAVILGQTMWSSQMLRSCCETQSVSATVDASVPPRRYDGLPPSRRPVPQQWRSEVTTTENPTPPSPTKRTLTALLIGGMLTAAVALPSNSPPPVTVTAASASKSVIYQKKDVDDRRMLRESTTTSTTSTIPPTTTTTTHTHPIQKPAPKPAAVAAPATACGGWEGLIAAHFPGEVSKACSVMMCESRGNPQAENSSSSASGLWQFLSSTWESTTGTPAPASQYSAETQTAAAAKLRNSSGWAAWSCS